MNSTTFGPLLPQALVAYRNVQARAVKDKPRVQLETLSARFSTAKRNNAAKWVRRS